ncbi:hypothetical protein P3L10_006542 [Capsicum annuum]
MMSPKPLSENRGSSHSTTIRQTPLQIIHVVGNFMRIWSVYSMYRYLSQTGASVVLFMFFCLLPSCIWFLVAQKPWKGRALSNTQVVPSVVNGGITALYFILWGKGLKSCGPVRAILGEYSGAVLGVLSGVLYGRGGRVWKKWLHMVFSSPRHLMVAGGCIIVMEIVYKMDFSLIGFLVCAAILGIGIYEATSLDRSRRDSFQRSGSNGILDDQMEMSPLPT